MPLQITSNSKDKVFGTFISLNTIRRMIRNMMNNTFKCHHSTKIPSPWNPHSDGRGIHFSKAEIDELFKRNMLASNETDSSTFGLRIYIAMHGESPEEFHEMPNRPLNYIGQHTTILVCTKNGQDLLDSDTHFVSAFSQSASKSMALDEGQICPPPACNSII